MYASRWLDCISTTPMPFAQASVSKQNGLLKSGVASTGAELRAVLRASNAA
jgi:hypothetical protein